MCKLMALGVRAGGRGGCRELAFRGDDEDWAVVKVHLDLGDGQCITNLRSVIASA